MLGYSVESLFVQQMCFLQVKLFVKLIEIDSVAQKKNLNRRNNGSMGMRKNVFMTYMWITQAPVLSSARSTPFCYAFC